MCTHNEDDAQDQTAGMRTPPTPPPPGSPIPARVRAVAQLRPVSIPDIVRDIAGSNPQQRIFFFNYIPYAYYVNYVNYDMYTCFGV